EKEQQRASNKIIIAQEKQKQTDPNKPKRGRPRKSQIIIAEEVPVQEKPPAYKKNFEIPKEEGVIEAKEDLTGSKKLSELSKDAGQFMERRKNRVENKNRTFDDERSM
ncbi:MAG: hypothetical protein IJF22_03270, partial [Clostridia bacterium]|nr:hypothetical protein [Clostridia bacterium]